jgi:DNA-binding response OmpR family regulator
MSPSGEPTVAWNTTTAYSDPVPPLVLLAEDDRAQRKLLRTYLAEEGIAVVEAGSGPEAFDRVRDRRPDLVVLDVRMPGFDGFELLRRLEAAGINVPVMMLTSVADEVDQLVGYRLGAVDYVAKPVSPKVMAAKVKAFVRRLSAPESGGRRTEIGPLVVEHDANRILVAGAEVALTRRERDLLLALAEHPGWISSREQLLASVWGYDESGETRLVDMHVANLRRKLEAAGAAGLVETVRGVGYRLASFTSS